MSRRLHFRNNICVLQRAEVHLRSTLLFHSLPWTGSAYSPVSSHSQPTISRNDVPWKCKQSEQKVGN